MKSFITKLKHFYLYDIKLQYKLLFSHLLLIILPTVVLTLFLYNRLYHSIISDTILSEQTLAAQTTSTIEDILSQVRQASDSLTESNASMRLFSDTPVHPFLLRSYTSSLEEMAENLTDGSLITDIQIYVEDSDDILQYTKKDTLFSPLSNIMGTYWYGIFSSRDTEALLCPSLYLSVSEEENRGNLAYIRRLDTKSRPEVYLAVYFSQDRLNTTLGANVSTDKSATYILNERDTVVASSSPALSGAYYMSNTTLQNLVGGVNQYSTRSYLKDSIYVGYYSISDTDWHLVSILSSESLVRKGNSLVLQFISIYVLFFILAMIISIFLSRSIAKRIATLIRQMQSVHHGRPVRIEMSQSSHDEIGDLVDTYNYMSDEINDLLDEQVKTAEKLKLQEFKALQSQINPHFLYNSLDMINWLAQIGKRREVTEAVQALSKFYKLTLSKKDTRGNVGIELEHVSLYVQLQNMRYENRIQFVIDVPDTLMDYEIPKLTLQPIVENCIQHGIMEKPDKTGTILITGWLEGEDLLLLISDDGVGMNEEQTASILSGDGRKKEGGSNIGIYNTHARLQLLYGPGYGLRYESRPGQGTDTQIRLPAIFGQT